MSGVLSIRVNTFISSSKVLSSVSEAFQYFTETDQFIASSQDGLSSFYLEALALQTQGSTELTRLEFQGSGLEKL